MAPMAAITTTGLSDQGSVKQSVTALPDQKLDNPRFTPIARLGHYVFGPNTRVILIEIPKVGGGHYGCTDQGPQTNSEGRPAGMSSRAAYISEHHFVVRSSGTGTSRVNLLPVGDPQEGHALRLKEVTAFGCNPREFREYIIDLLTSDYPGGGLASLASNFDRSVVLAVSDCGQTRTSMSLADYCRKAGIRSTV